jgi:hypothetical protein
MLTSISTKLVFQKQKVLNRMKTRSLLAAFSLVCAATLVPSTAASGAECVGSLQNGGFETPVLSSLVVGDVFVSGGLPIWNGPGAPTTYAMVNSLPDVDNAVSQGLVWRSTEDAVEIQNITPFVGNQYGEIIGLDPTATVYQSIATSPGVVMEWSLAHRGYSSAGPDSMEVLIGPSLDSLDAQPATPETGTGVVGQPATIADSTTWRVWRGSYTVPAGQTTTFFAFNSISSAGGATNLGNFIDSVSFDCAANQPADELANTGIEASFLGWTALAMFGGLGLVGVSLLNLRRRSRS